MIKSYKSFGTRDKISKDIPWDYMSRNGGIK